jgi:hypothetical protein
VCRANEEEELRRSEEIVLQARMSVWWRKQVTRAAARHQGGASLSSQGISSSSAWDSLLAWLESSSEAIEQPVQAPSSAAAGTMSQAQEVYVWRLIKRMRQARPHSRPYGTVITVWPCESGAAEQLPRWVEEIVGVLASHHHHHHHHGRHDAADGIGEGRSRGMRTRVQAARQEVAHRLSTLRRGHRQARMAAAIHIQVVPPLLIRLIGLNSHVLCRSGVM